MVKFTSTMGGYDVSVNDQMFGHIAQEHGFFQDPTTIKKFITVGATDLEVIAQAVDNVKRTGYVHNVAIGAEHAKPRT